jgi:hypothetical protein
MPFTLPPQPQTILASAAHTADSTSGPFDGVKGNYRGVLIVLDVTAATTGTVTINVQDKSGPADVWTTRLASSAITAVGTTLLLLHPAAPDRANVSENTSLKYMWRVFADKSDATAKTYSITAYYLP